MKLDRVTVTGADDSIRPEDLLPLTDKYPFVEWGILFSAKRQGTPRYPSLPWLKELQKVVFAPDPATPDLQLSAHLCGKWVRDLVLKGDFSFKHQYDHLWRFFQRLQLNFHGQFHRACAEFRQELRKSNSKAFILQHDGINDGTIHTLARDLPLFVLFDRSGGAGVVPGTWPKPIDEEYCGYAGGLGPENLAEEIRRIEASAGENRIWIDMETRVRSEDDMKFDLKKVEDCLEQAAAFVK